VRPSSGLHQTKLVMAPRPEPESAKRTHNDMLSEDMPSGARNYHLSFGMDFFWTILAESMVFFAIQ